MLQKSSQVLKDLQSGKLHPIYFLHGEESFFIDQISDWIENKVLNPSEKGFNMTILYGRDSQMNQVLSQARRFPMMASRQVVIVKEIQQMPDWNKAGSFPALSNYLENPQASTVLVLNHKHKSFAKNNKLYKLLEKQAIVVESKKLYENQIPDWINHYLKGKKQKIEEKARQLLVEAIGADLSRLSGELDKLLLNAPKDALIDAEMVEKYIGISKEYNVFELQSAIAQRDMLKAQKIVRYWAANPKKQPLIPTLALLYSFFYKTLLAYSQKDRSEGNLARVLKISPYFVREYQAMLRQYSRREVMQAVHLIHRADLQVKGIAPGPNKEAAILNEFLSQLML